MMPRLMTTLLTLALVAGLAPSVEAKVRHHKRVHARPSATWHAPSAYEPARMIQVRPGLWVSSYGCVTDEGYGRIEPCDVGEGKR